MAIRQVKVQPDWDSLWVTDVAGNELVDTEGSLVYVGDREYFQHVKKTRQPFVSNLFIGRISQNKIIAVAYPIIRHGTFQGILAAGIKPKDIQRVFTQVPVDENSTISLWGSDRKPIAWTEQTSATPSALNFAPEAAHAIFSGHPGKLTSKSPFTRQDALIGYAQVGIAHWTVVASTPSSDAMAIITRTMSLFLVLSLLVLALTLLWSFYSADIVAQQVAKLAYGAREIGEGKLTTRITLNADGELADLADSLNKMAANLQVLDRLKSDLLSMVSHELKTPLTSIRASLDLIASGTIPIDHPRYQELLDIADRQSRRLQDMIENLLSVARLESGGLAITRRDTRLKSIIMTSVRQYEDLAKAKNLTVTIDVPDDMLVYADAPKVTLAVNNLLDNAIKFTEQGSIAIHASRSDDMAIISIKDTGIGLTPDVRSRLFERFYQAEPLLTRKTGGAGLGLFVTKAIIEGHGGQVFAKSNEPDHGSTFGFTLPLAETATHGKQTQNV